MSELQPRLDLFLVRHRHCSGTLVGCYLLLFSATAEIENCYDGAAGPLLRNEVEVPEKLNVIIIVMTVRKLMEVSGSSQPNRHRHLSNPD